MDPFTDFGAFHLNGAMVCNLSNFHTNNKNMVEVQLKRKFLRMQSTSFLEIPDEAKNLFELLDAKESGSIKETVTDPYSILNLQSLACNDIYNSISYDYSYDQSQMKILSCCL